MQDLTELYDRNESLTLVPEGSGNAFQDEWTRNFNPAPLITGELVQDPDFVLPSTAGNIPWRLFYFSKSRDVKGPYGYGRRASFPVRLCPHEVGNSIFVTVEHEDGGGASYTSNDNGLTFKCNTQRVFDQLELVEDGYIETRLSSGTKYYYPFPEETGGHIYLSHYTTVHGKTVTMTYSDGNLSEITEPFGRKIRFGYNTNDLVEYVEDWDANRRHTFAYDSNDCLNSITDPGGYVTTFGYTKTTLLNSITNPLGFKTTYIYDSSDRVISQRTGTRIYTYTYNYSGVINSTLATDPLGNSWLTKIDSMTNVQAVTDALGFVRTAAYNPKGMPILLVDAVGRRTTSTYNAQGKEIARIEPNEGLYTRMYDTFGNLTSETDPFGRVHNYFYGSTDSQREKRLLLWEQDALGRYTTYTYRTWGAMESMTTPTGARNTHLYDEDKGLLIGEIDPRGGRRTYFYDSAGNRTAEVDGLGRRTTYTYDRLWRNISVVEPTGAVQTTVFDGVGNTIAEIDPYGYRTTYQYDVLQNRILEQDAKGYRFTTVYDAKGREIARIDPLGKLTTSAYDVADRRIAEIDSLGLRTTTSYDFARRPIVARDSAGLRYTTIYDVQLGTDYWATAQVAPSGHRTTSIFNRIGELVATQDTSGLRTTSIYDAIGRVRAVIEPTGARTTTNYEFSVPGFTGWANETMDAHGNISTSLYDLDGNLVVTIDPIGQRYTTVYNLVGERVQEISADGTILSRVYDPILNQETTTNFVDKTTITTFDLLGRVISFTDETASTTHEIYDPLGLPLQTIDQLGNTSETTYDAARRPILFEDTTTYSSATSYRADNSVLQQWEGQAGVALEYIEYQYDSFGRYTGSKNGLNEQEGIRYDNQGRPVASIAKNGTAVTYEYNTANGWLEAELHPDGGRNTLLWDNYGRDIGYIDEEGATSQWLLDLLYRPIVGIDSLGQRTTYSYNPVGQITTIQDALGTLYTNSYNPFGNADFVIDALGHRTTYHYDQFQRLVSVENALGHRITTYYDSFGRIYATEDARGDRVTTYYDALGRDASVIDPFGQRTTTHFDEFGRFKATENSLGHRITIHYDERNRIIGNEDALGHRTTLGYDLAGRVATIMDALGSITTTKYDQFGRPRASQDVLGNTTTTHYDSYGRVGAMENARGYRISYFYDKRGRLIVSQDEKGYRTTTTYDALGRVVTITDELGFQNQTIYDPLNRPIATIDPLGYRTTTSFDVLGQVVAVQDALNQRITMKYDAIGQLIAYTNSKGLVTTNQYDPVGNRTTVITPLGQATAYTFDALNRVVAKRDPLGRVWTTAYDAAGRMLVEVDAKGQRTTSLFNSRGENTGRNYADPTLTMTFGYDALGRLKTAQDTTGRYTWGYDAMGRVVTYESPQNPKGQPLTYGYDANSNLIRRSIPAGVLTYEYSVFTYEYDERDQQKRMIEPGFIAAAVTGGVTTFEYDERGLLKRQENFDGTLATFTYDGQGQILGVRHVKVSDGTELERSYYEYDAVGKPLYKATKEGRHTYSYDVLGQLTGEEITLGSTSKRLTWAYDAADRRTTYLFDNVTRTYIYDNADQLLFANTKIGTYTYRTTFTYDANGSQIVRVDPNQPLQAYGYLAPRTTYGWNAANQLTSIRNNLGYILTNTYSFDGMRHEAQRTAPPYAPYLENGYNEVVFVEDSVPSGATQATQNDAWTWVTEDPFPYSGTQAHQSNLTFTYGQHWFGFPSPNPAWKLYAGDIIYCYVYLDPTNPPQQLLLRFEKWSSPGYNHQASWGPLLAQWVAGAVTLGAVPPTGSWAYLEVPVEAIGLEGETIRGVSFACASNTTGAKVTWDQLGVLRPVGKSYQRSGKERYLWEGNDPTRFERRVERIWLDDSNSFPPGSTTGVENDAWNWVSSSPTQYSGTDAHRSNIYAGAHQHWFTDVTTPLSLQSGDLISCWVYRDGSNSPAEIMLRFDSVETPGFKHQAYWGSNDLNYTPGQVSMGALPTANQWVRLDVPADTVGLAGKSLKGVSFALYNGRVTWDRLTVTRAELVQEATLGGDDNQVLRTAGQSVPVSPSSLPTIDGQVHRLHRDAQGSPELVTDGAVGVAGAFAFDGFGNQLQGTGATQPDKAFEDSTWTGYIGGLSYWNEPDFGLYYVRARWLDTDAGRWLSVDPVDGEPRYSYVRNSPSYAIDPEGMQSKPAALPPGGLPNVPPLFTPGINDLNWTFPRAKNPHPGLEKYGATSSDLGNFFNQNQPYRSWVVDIPSDNIPSSILANFGARLLNGISSISESVSLSKINSEIAKFTEKHWKTVVENQAIAWEKKQSSSQSKHQSSPTPTIIERLLGIGYAHAERSDLNGKSFAVPSNPTQNNLSKKLSGGDYIRWSGGFIAGICEKISLLNSKILNTIEMIGAPYKIFQLAQEFLKPNNLTILLKSIPSLIGSKITTLIKDYSKRWKQSKYQQGRIFGELTGFLVSFLMNICAVVSGVSFILKNLKDVFQRLNIKSKPTSNDKFVYAIMQGHWNGKKHSREEAEKIAKEATDDTPSFDVFVKKFPIKETHPKNIRTPQDLKLLAVKKSKYYSQIYPDKFADVRQRNPTTPATMMAAGIADTGTGRYFEIGGMSGVVSSGFRGNGMQLSDAPEFPSDFNQTMNNYLRKRWKTTGLVTFPKDNCAELMVVYRFIKWKNEKKFPNAKIYIATSHIDSKEHVDACPLCKLLHSVDGVIIVNKEDV